MKAKGRGQPARRLRERVIGIPMRDAPAVQDVVRPLIDDARGIPRKRSFPVQHDRQPIVLDSNECRRCLRGLPAFRDDRGHRLARVDDLAYRQWADVRVPAAGNRRIDSVGDLLDVTRDLIPGDRHHDTRLSRGRRHVNGADPCMGVRTANDGHVQHPGEDQIGDEPRLPRDDLVAVKEWNGPSDVP